MIPTLFDADYIPPEGSSHYRNYPPHGDVDLVDAIECFAVQTGDDDSVEWELEMTYPVTGAGFGELEYGKIIAVKANSYQSHLQGFRIYSIQKRIDKSVVVKAQHISYDLANVPMENFRIAKTKNSDPQSAAVKAILKLREGNSYEERIVGCKFWFATDFNDGSRLSTDNDKLEIDEPKSMRAVLLDGDNSVRGTYGGNLVIDNYRIDLDRVGGEDRGVTIVYGIDLIDLDQEQNISEMITGILPYYRENSKKEDEEPKITYGSVYPGWSTQNNYPPGVRKIVPVDMTSYVDKKDSDSTSELKTKINTEAEKWVKKNKKKEHIGEPELSLKVSYAYLDQNVQMYDAIAVEFPKLKVKTSGRVVKYKYNVLLERCEEIELDHAKSSKYFNLMDANKLRKGYIPPERVGKGSIRGGAGGHIQKKTVTGDDMEDNTIHHNQLANKEKNGETPIQTGNIAQYAIEPDLIASGALNSTTVPRIVANRSLTGSKIAAGADGITNENIKDGVITQIKMFEHLSEKINKASQDAEYAVNWIEQHPQ